MLTGRLFKLGRPTVAVYVDAEKRQISRIPPGSVIRIIAEGSSDLLVGVLLDGSTVEVFSEDVRACGSEVLRSVNGVAKPPYSNVSSMLTAKAG